MNRGTKFAWLNRNIWLKLRTKGRVYDFLKKKRAVQKDYEDVLRSCREKLRITKPRPEIVWLLL